MDLSEAKARFRVIDGGLSAAEPQAVTATPARSSALQSEFTRIAGLLSHLRALREEIARERDFWRDLETSVEGLLPPAPHKAWWQRITG